MSAEKYSVSRPEKFPEWYWTDGLHDACITACETFEFPIDYNKYIGKKDKHNQTLLQLKINSKDALYDTSVTEIRFFNYEILTPEISLKNRNAIWWISDKLTVNDNNFVLEISLSDYDSFPEDFTFTIRFERAETVRT